MVDPYSLGRAAPGVLRIEATKGSCPSVKDGKGSSRRQGRATRGRRRQGRCGNWPPHREFRIVEWRISWSCMSVMSRPHKHYITWYVHTSRVVLRASASPKKFVSGPNAHDRYHNDRRFEGHQPHIRRTCPEISHLHFKERERGDPTFRTRDSAGKRMAITFGGRDRWLRNQIHESSTSGANHPPSRDSLANETQSFPLSGLRHCWIWINRCRS